MPDSRERKAGDRIINRYMPGVDTEEREKARDSIHRLARFLIRVHKRLVHEHGDIEIREKAPRALDSETSCTIV